MMRELPICSSACIILPSGPAARDVSSAPSAFLYQSIASAALSNVSCGVIVWSPWGTALFAFAMSTSVMMYWPVRRAAPPRTREKADERHAMRCRSAVGRIDTAPMPMPAASSASVPPAVHLRPVIVTLSRKTRRTDEPRVVLDAFVPVQSPRSPETARHRHCGGDSRGHTDGDQRRADHAAALVGQRAADQQTHAGSQRRAGADDETELGYTQNQSLHHVNSSFCGGACISGTGDRFLTAEEGMSRTAACGSGCTVSGALKQRSILAVEVRRGCRVEKPRPLPTYR